MRAGPQTGRVEPGVVTRQDYTVHCVSRRCRGWVDLVANCAGNVAFMWPDRTAAASWLVDVLHALCCFQISLCAVRLTGQVPALAEPACHWCSGRHIFPVGRTTVRHTGYVFCLCNRQVSCIGPGSWVYRSLPSWFCGRVLHHCCPGRPVTANMGTRSILAVLSSINLLLQAEAGLLPVGAWKPSQGFAQWSLYHSSGLQRCDPDLCP